MLLLCNDVSHWLGTSLESALTPIFKVIISQIMAMLVVLGLILLSVHHVTGPDTLNPSQAKNDYSMITRPILWLL